MPEQLIKSSFDPHVGSSFEIYSERNGKVKVELVEVSDHSNEQINGFSVIFRGPLENQLYQAIYKMKHEKMGEISLFLVPILYGKTDAIYYEAVFSRLIEK